MREEACGNYERKNCVSADVDWNPGIGAHPSKRSDLPWGVMTLPMAVRIDPFSPYSTQLCVSGIYLIKQAFTAL